MCCVDLFVPFFFPLRGGSNCNQLGSAMVRPAVYDLIEMNRQLVAIQRRANANICIVDLILILTLSPPPPSRRHRVPFVRPCLSHADFRTLQSDGMAGPRL